MSPAEGRRARVVASPRSSCPPAGSAMGFLFVLA